MNKLQKNISIHHHWTKLDADIQAVLIALTPFQTYINIEEQMLATYVMLLNSEGYFHLNEKVFDVALREGVDLGWLYLEEDASFIQIQPAIALFLKHQRNLLSIETREMLQKAFLQYYHYYLSYVDEFIKSHNQNQIEDGLLVTYFEQDTLRYVIQNAFRFKSEFIEFYLSILTSYMTFAKEYREMLFWLDGFLDLLDKQVPSDYVTMLRITATIEQANAQLALEKYTFAVLLYQKASEINTFSGDYLDDYLQAQILNNLGVAWFQLTKYEEAIKNFKMASSFPFYQEHPVEQAEIYQNLGNVSFKKKDYKEAEYYYLEALRIFEEAHVEHGKMAIYQNLGTLLSSECTIETDTKQVQQAKQYMLNAYQLALDLEDYQTLAMSSVALGILAYRREMYEKAIGFIQKTLYLTSQFDFVHIEGQAFELYALVKYKLGNYQEAIDYCHKAMNAFQEIDDEYKLGNVYALFGDCFLELADGAPEAEGIASLRKMQLFYQKAVVIFEKFEDWENKNRMQEAIQVIDLLDD